MYEEDLIELTQIFNLLTTPRRLQIVRALLESPEPLMFSALCRLVGLPLPQAAYNLRRLKEANLIIKHRVGRRVFYGLNMEPITKIRKFLEVPTNGPETRTIQPTETLEVAGDSEQ